MSPAVAGSRRVWIRSIALAAVLAATGGGLAAWKSASIREAAAASASFPEPMEVVTSATATQREHRQTTTAIGTVRALQSITLRNELAGTVSRVTLSPGQIVDSGTVLVALDVSVEEADLDAQQAQATLAQTTLDRLLRLRSSQATSEEELDQARAEQAVALARVARNRAIIARKTLRAPFRARVGITDVHPGQYLNEGTELTTLQGVAEASHVDFSVAQEVARGIRQGQRVEVFTGTSERAIPATIVAVDARVDPTTRNAMVRARMVSDAAAPGASVRVEVPVGPSGMAVAVPASALRKGPGGDHVFVLSADSTGKTRAHLRQVQAGDVLGDDVIILAGLRPGEKVAASGSFKLREGVLVMPAQVAATAANGSR